MVQILIGGRGHRGGRKDHEGADGGTQPAPRLRPAAVGGAR